ncbi:acyl-CoA carboxylase subunit epsilon [Tessaracoccus sp. OS52]|uniref:acyl-CoA carboxylase subunit epsilon n=1 Tax=Tessaracoccus sp. OS52 TaxID=2886691 RepID=UPI001D112DBE|nr:acyl-CoA carboxylase subunit epsilon [Tessaracoccus sp. OS52]
MNGSADYEFSATSASEEEVTAVLAVLRAREREARLQPADDRPLAGGWKSYYRTVRAPLVYGRDAWRTTSRKP